MSFQWPAMLLGLAIVPLALAAYVVAQRRRKRFAVRFTNLDLLANVVSESPRWRRHLPPLLTLLALAALVLALARPHTSVAVPKQRATVILVTDASGSMQALDVKPDRLSAAREAAQTFSDRLPKQFRLGLVSFNNQSQLLVPPTTDRKLVKQALDGLAAGGGTAMGNGLQNALSAVREVAGRSGAGTTGATGPGGGATGPGGTTGGGPTGGGGTSGDRAGDRPAGRRDPPAVVVMLSDGKNTGGADPVEVARDARRLGVPVNTVALGTDQGTVDVQGPDGFVQTIPVPPDRDTLRQIAKTSRGRFFAAPDAGKLQSIYKSLGSRIGYTHERRELTAAFAGAGLGLLLIGGTFSLLWFGRLP
jgi:Ca-activated chloride channel family protein